MLQNQNYLCFSNFPAPCFPNWIAAVYAKVLKKASLAQGKCLTLMLITLLIAGAGRHQ